HQVVVDDGQHLHDGLDLAPHVGGDDGAAFGGDHAHAGDRKFTEQYDRQHDGRAQTVHDHIDEGCGRQASVGQGVHELAEIGDEVVFAGQIAVEEIGKTGCGKHDAGQQVHDGVI